MKPSETKAVLFDVDGTLLDTTTFVVDAYKYTLSSIGAEIPDLDAIMKKLFGIPLRQCYEILVPDQDAAILCKIHDDWQNKNLHLVSPFQTVAQTIAQLQERNIRMAAVTNRLRTSAETILKNGKVTQMEAIIGFEDVINPKPDSEGIHKALSLLGAQPHESFMVGDSEFDILAGKHAGVRTIGVRSGLHPEAMEQANPDFLVDEMLEIIEIV